jgi:hypothetical protein
VFARLCSSLLICLPVGKVPECKVGDSYHKSFEILEHGSDRECMVYLDFGLLGSIEPCAWLGNVSIVLTCVKLRHLR